MFQATQAGERDDGREALTELYDRHGAGIYRFLHSMVDDAEQAREHCQEIFLALLPALRRGERPGRAYLYRCARNAVISRLRRRGSERRWLALAGDAPDSPGKPLALPAPDRELERSELRGALLAALGELPEGLRAVFLLIELEGLSYRETAEALELAPGTVASRKHEALRRLRETLRRSGHAL
jgi:RNA polymerase sigma-70 factor, ECF subfamily